MFIVPGIGRLVKSDRKARWGRNPATGAKIRIPAKKVVKFLGGAAAVGGLAYVLIKLLGKLEPKKEES